MKARIKTVIRRELIKRTMRVATLTTKFMGDGSAMTRQLDIALMSAGFKMSKDLLNYLSERNPIVIREVAESVLPAVRELVGDHVEHNIYFIHFPENIPDTEAFWTSCIVDALFNPASASNIALQLQTGVVNLLDLPKYGKYQHSYEDMLEAHDQFIPLIEDRITMLHLGKTLVDETVDFYHSLAGSRIPLNEDDRGFLRELAEICLSELQPETIPVKENKALIDLVRLENTRPLLADTLTDVLRLACAASDGDETLQEKTKFKSFTRRARLVILETLDKIAKTSPNKLADVNQYAERWKRLGERLHPHEYDLPYAQDVFAVARGKKKVQSLMAAAEAAFIRRNIPEAISVLSNVPGVLFRNVDRILRYQESVIAVECVNCEESLMKAIEKTIDKVSGRVILSLREHLMNRLYQMENRIFANSKGTAWVEADKRRPFNSETVNKLCDIFDENIASRLPVCDLLVDEEVLGMAIPLSEKSKASGFGIMPRGSVTNICTPFSLKTIERGDVLRFFIYWKQKSETTDYDLSALLLDEDFQFHGQLSYTSLKHGGCVHSGDLVISPDGASEFVDITLADVDYKYVIPQVNVYSGEHFDEIEECFFGFMIRSQGQKGKPFEARTVRMKSDLNAKGKVALPIVFINEGAGGWTAKWMHLYLKGRVNMNRVENNRVNTSLLTETIIRRDYLRVGYLVDLMEQKASSFSTYQKGQIGKAGTYIGIEAPEGFATAEIEKASKIYTLANLKDLIPA